MVIVNELCSFIDHFKNAPDHNEVLKLLADISAHWEDVGLALNVPHDDLDGLVKAACSNKSKLSKVIRLWINTKSSPVTWEALISAIGGTLVNNKRKAGQIHDHVHHRQN